MRQLPKGIRLDRGYVQVRLFNDGQQYTRNFGTDSPIARELATIHLAEKRKEILMGKFGIKNEGEKKTFSQVGELFFDLWGSEKDPNGQRVRSEHNVNRARNVYERSLLPFFGKKVYSLIAPLDVQRWRKDRLLSVRGTSVNREQNLLSSIFSSVERWIELKELDAFAIPDKNPCQFIEQAEMVVRERIATEYEISKLKNAAKELGDHVGCDNISLALKTSLSDKDLKTLKFGDTVDLKRSKSGVRVVLPLTVWFHPDWTNWGPRWYAIRKKAGCPDLQWRDLRKTGGNLLFAEAGVVLKDVSEFMGHADEKTTKKHYIKVRQQRMGILAQKLSDKIDSL